MIKAAVFDMDGTLLDSMPYWHMSGELYLKSLGIQARPGLGDILFDRTLPEVADYMQQHYGVTEPKQAIMDGINDIVNGFYLRDAPLKEGVLDYLQYLHGRGIPMMVATVTDRYLVEAALERLGVLVYFQGLVTTAEVGVGKYRPDVFLKCAALLGVQPEQTLVFEDALHAVKTAAAAGFPTVGVYDFASEASQGELEQVATFYLPTFTQARERIALD